jgi:Uma2 family endonuclease
MNAAVQPKLSAQDYLDWEANQPEKHEYFRGEVFAMVGVSRPHAEVSRNVVTLLAGLLGSRGCRAYASDIKVRVESANAYYYPDVLVTCSKRDLTSAAVMTEPTIIFEVLSPSTASYDRGLKFATYRQLPSLQQYVLLDPEALTIDSYIRTDAGWLLVETPAGQPLLLPKVELALGWDEVFRYVVPEST